MANKHPSWLVKYDPSMCETVLEEFQKGRSITSVACTLGIVRDTYYRWKEEHPDFGEACKLGEQLSQQYWEHKGEEGIFGEIDKFAGSSWQFVMKNRFRDSYQADQQKQEGGTAVEMLIGLLADKK